MRTINSLDKSNVKTTPVDFKKVFCLLWGLLIFLFDVRTTYAQPVETNGWKLLKIGMSLREARKIINTICIDIEKDWSGDPIYLNCIVPFYGHPIQSISAGSRGSFYFLKKLDYLEITLSNINKLEKLEKSFDDKWIVSKDWGCDEEKKPITDKVVTYCTKQYKILGEYDGEFVKMSNLLTEYENHLTVEYCSPFYPFCY